MSQPMTETVTQRLDLVQEPIGWFLFVVFVIGYYFIATEEKYHINKAKPALFTGTFMFIVIAGYYAILGKSLGPVEREVEHLILEIAEIFFFLYVAMTFIEALIERGVFNSLKGNLLTKGYDNKKLFWVTGLLAFFISPVADNLTTALILSTVLVTISKEKAFLIPGAVNIVVAANAGGAWSPFGDITTLMAWSAEKGHFVDFLFLFPASIIGWLVTAVLLSRYVPEGHPAEVKSSEPVKGMQKGAKVVIALGVFTIAAAVFGKQFLHLPPMWGMLFGLSLLKLYSYQLKRKHKQDIKIYEAIAKVENDTLLFFFGILAAVGALYFAGFLDYAVKLYQHTDIHGAIVGFEPTYVNIGVGFLSAIVDNVPVMSAVLKASPDMDLAQWMLVTLTAGVGGSLISFGSAAGVGVMGKLYGIYTFGAHMRLSWTVLVGYIVSVAVWYLQYQVAEIYIKPDTNKTHIEKATH